jgi:hypothetical protein
MANNVIILLAMQLVEKVSVIKTQMYLQKRDLWLEKILEQLHRRAKGKT